MRPNRHLIQRQIIDLAIGVRADGPAVHRELARPFWDRAVSDLEPVFDGVAGPNELLRLDRLELDLGAIDGADWPVELRKKLVAELARTLARFTAGLVRRDEKAPNDRQPSEPWQQFLFFLVHGYLPWWSSGPVETWDEALLKASDAGWSALRELVLADRRARLRLVYSVGNEILDRAVATWSGLTQSAHVLGRWAPAQHGLDSRRGWRRGFWMTVLDRALDSSFSPRGGPELVRDLLTLRRMCAPAGARDESVRQAPGDGREENAWIRGAWNGDLPDPWQTWLRSQADLPPFEHAVPGMRTDGRVADARAPVSAPPQDGAARDPVQRVVEDDEAIYLGGAGAVLLHPFLEQLFHDRGLLDRRGFRDSEARAKAVRLLGFLTFGTLNLAEYELVLAKVLCGAVLEEPLEPVPLENDDVAACEALLDAVLEHWTALHSSSREWLRQHFFLREGKLERADSGYLLTIERRAQDVLLTRLPWGCGVVALPWLTDRIFVHWLD